MINKNYYKISENLSPLQFQTTTKEEKSSLENILVRLRENRELSSDFSTKWEQIKGNIEQKKSGIGGLIFRFLFWLNGKNELIKAIDAKLVKANISPGINLKRQVQNFSSSIVENEKISRRRNFEIELSNFSLLIVEDGAQAHQILKDAPPDSYRLWRDRSNSEKFYLMYKASPTRTYVEVHRLSLDNKEWRSKTFENPSISSLATLDVQPENCTPIIGKSNWSFEFFSINTIIEHAQVAEKLRQKDLNKELYSLQSLIFDDMEQAKLNVRPYSYVIYKDPQNPENLSIVLNRKQIKVFPLDITHSLKEQIDEYIKAEQALEMPFRNSKQQEQCEQLHNEKQVFSGRTVTTATFSLQHTKPGTYKLCRLDKFHYDLIRHQATDGEIALIMMQNNGTPFWHLIPYDADIREVIQERLKLPATQAY